VIDVEDWAEIRRLHRSEQMPIRAIARHLGVSRNTVRRALAGNAPPKYQRESRGSIVDAVEPQIRELLQKFPEMPATVIAERIGWTHSYEVVKRRVRELRPVYRAADPVSRTGYEPGELAYLTRTLKAPALGEASARLAERARSEGWSHEEYLAACLQREVAARDSHGAEGASAQPVSPRGSRWRTSTSTTSGRSNGRRSRTSGRSTSWSGRRT
jgi:helix-turn-helix resolvase-like protein